MDENNSNNESSESKVENNMDNNEVRRTQNSEKKEKVYVQYRKPSVFSSILLWLIGFLTAAVVLLVVYIFKGPKETVVYKEPETSVSEEGNSKEENKEEEGIKLNLSLNGEFVQGLYSKIPMQTRGVEPYYSTGAKASTISDSNKLLFVLRSLESEYKYETIPDISSVESKLDKYISGMRSELESRGSKYIEVHKFSFNTVESKYKSVFGSSLELPLIDADTNLGYMYEYVSSDNCFYGYYYVGGGGSYFTYQTRLTKCEQNSDGTEVYVYDDFLAFDCGADDYNSFYLYDSSDENKKVTEKLSGDYNNSEELIKNNMDKAGHFKHTFKLDSDGNYYWYSSEKI